VGDCVVRSEVACADMVEELADRFGVQKVHLAVITGIQPDEG